jgi:LPS-assembly protein
VKFKRLFLIFSILIYSLGSSNSVARENFSFKIGDQVQVLSDKAFRKTKLNIFEAVGNVIITHQNNAIYGEKASLKFETGETEVIGNVRYVGPEYTVYGTRMDYNFNSTFLEVKNGRIISDNYVVLGKSLIKREDGVIVGEDAEYTTCKDCPESWSILGKKVHITVGQYIRIKHAFIKAKGVIIMYIPYLVLPIKKNRETGLLFPKFSLNFDTGVKFGLPWFWAISNSTDMTITPKLYGDRGFGGEFQFRHEFADRKWLELNSLQTQDQVYLPLKQDREDSGEKVFRNQYDFEYNLDIGNSIRHHTYFSGLNDLDMFRDYGNFASDKIIGPEAGVSSFVSYYTDYIDFNLEADFNRNLLYTNPKGFDHSFVQVLPKFSMNLIPLSLFQSNIPLLNRFSFDLSSDATIFKQNHKEEVSYIRNATRVNVKPSFNWDMGQIGPMFLISKATFDGQFYEFPYEDSQKTFRKSAIVYENKVSFQFEKLFSVAYKESIPIKTIDIDKSEHPSLEKDEEVLEDPKAPKLIGNFPLQDFAKTGENLIITQNSYRNSQEIAFKHYYLGRNREIGNTSFLEQIENSAGQFDNLDAIKSKTLEISHESAITTLPLSNTLEFQWNNILYKKSPKDINVFQDNKGLKNNFDYSQKAYFNLSQGYDFTAPGESTIDKLTRLYTATGFSLARFSFSAYDYYFHKFNEHIFSLNFKQSFDHISLNASFKYDSFSTPVNKTINAGTTINPNDLLKFSASYEFDYNRKEISKSSYSAMYLPENNCWRFGVDYATTRIEKSVALTFLINFNENNFTSLSGIQ